VQTYDSPDYAAHYHKLRASSVSLHLAGYRVMELVEKLNKIGLTAFRTDSQFYVLSTSII
jgi:hypothetical protein